MEGELPKTAPRAGRALSGQCHPMGDGVRAATAPSCWGQRCQVGDSQPVVPNPAGCGMDTGVLKEMWRKDSAARAVAETPAGGDRRPRHHRG